ncbi:MAG: hypothetical protein JNJ58_00965 [Chitinophagaceae bacterium]|nr:hypothetical protein [Chitinophagaceae bacterium]
MIKRILLVFTLLVCLIVTNVSAQTFGNEWINYNQSYYKFKIATDGIFRIPVSTLTALGLPSTVQGDHFQLFRNGIEIPIFVSTGGQLGSLDYIEFFGEKANGILDTALYKSPSFQLNPGQSLISDTAAYFLTYNTSTNNKRFTFLNNNLSSPPLKETYFWDKIRLNYRVSFAPGPSYYGQFNTPVIYLNSSQYEDGEGYSKLFTSNNDSVTLTCTSPYIITGGPVAYFKSTVVGNSYLTTHRLKIFANNNEIADSTFGSFNYKRFNVAVPMSYMNAQNKFVFKYTPLNNGGNYADRYGINSIEFRYPRQFNFSNLTSFYFELDPKITDYYLEITNFNTGGVSPRLYDITSGEYLLGDISVTGKVRFLIPASSTVKRLSLQSQAAATYGSVVGLSPINFKNFTLPANQGDYIMISHEKLIDDGSGVKPIDDYKAYRNSAAGGGYNVTVVNQEDIFNEFGYGTYFHPQAIKNFLHFAVKNSQWGTKPKYALLIGKGISYKDYMTYSVAPFTTYPFYAVPSFGEPSSDLLLTDFDKNSKPQLSIGRISVMTTDEIGIYLQKLKDHEAALYNTSWQLSDSVLWRKRVLHIAGTNSAAEQAPIVSYLNGHEKIISSSYYGGQVTTVKKGSTSPVETANNQTIDNMFNNGVGIIEFFGHGSATKLDYNLDFPVNYKNYKRYPVFIANGCGVGNNFILTGLKTLGESYNLIPDKGTIAFVASVTTGLTGSLGTYTDSLYGNISKNNYGEPLGDQIRQNVLKLNTLPGFANDNLLRIHTEHIALNGDPAMRLYSYEKPDYAIEEKEVNFEQINLTTSIDSLDLKMVIYNLGKFSKDSVSLLVKRILPNNVENVILNTRYPGIGFSDTLHLKIPTYGDIGLGLNSLEVYLDQEAVVDEISENNNVVRKNFTIYNDDLVPVYPYENSIIGTQGVILKSSTLNPFAPTKSYLIQIDTTERFNSPMLVKTSISSAGGVIKWQPNITLRDSTVYYWRTAMDTLYGNTIHRWTNSSFVYIDQSLPGWNQSHYFQFKKDSYTDIKLDSASRRFNFIGLDKKLQIQNVCLNGPAPYTYGWPDYLAKINGSTLYTFGCDAYPLYASLQFVVIDTLTGLPWSNRKDSITGQGRFGSHFPCRTGSGCDAQGNNCTDPFFEFSFLTANDRQKILDFIDSIPNGFYYLIQPYISVTSSPSGNNKTFINQWMADTTTLGPGNSLYHKLYNAGFTAIDSFYKNRPFILWSRKGMPASTLQYVGSDSTKKLFAEFNFTSYLYEGKIVTNKIGPASQWSNFIRKGFSLDASAGDTVTVEVYGIDHQNLETLLATVQGDTSLSFIDANLYPNLRLAMKNRDNIFTTPEQLKYWRVHYQPVPEAALNPNRHFVFKDTVGQGQKQMISVALENLTDIPMDSMLMKFDIIDKNKNKSQLALNRYKPLPILDTIHIDLELPSGTLSGDNILVIEANPSNDQLEQFHPNNVGFKNFYVVGDSKNPLIDVTFDGVHILDKDIVSSKPFINIVLKDENKYLALDDTSLVSVYMRYHNENASVENYIPYDGQTLKFIPADLTKSGNKNQARIEFRPVFTEDGDDYMLIVRAKDKSGNASGTNAYKVGFEVVSKPSISSVLNYPNPFTTSTQFVFTITGYEVPSNMKIQILSPTGKVVREILKAELGPLHIGRNITEFKWKGDDQYGQPLANGVYLYRVVTSLNGSKMDHYQNASADKWIEKGFGKLYIMR